jgi:hypothetical protein
MDSFSPTSITDGRFQEQECDSRPNTSDVVSRKAAFYILLGLTAYAMARTLAYAHSRSFWIDEFLTQAVCRQPNLEAIWQVLNHGLDGMPPVFYIIERSVASLFSNEEIGWRFLSMLGFCTTLVLIFVLVKKRNGTAPALVCASLSLMTPLFTYYAAEARPYALVTACVAFALVCYQRMTSALWVGGMFLSLFVAISLHYLAVLPWLCFLVAEITLVYQTKQVRVKVWLALFGALVPIMFSLPLLFRINEIYGLHNIARLYPHTFGTTYATFFGAGSAWSTALAGTVSLVLLASFFSKVRRRTDKLLGPISERVLVLGLVALPVVGYVLAKATNGPFVDRYYLPSILGVIMVIGHLLGRARQRSMMIAATIVMLALITQERTFWVTLRYGSVLDEETQQIDALAKVVHHDDLPIVISDLQAYLKAWHYGRPALRKRIKGLVDPVNAVVYSGADSSDNLMTVYRKYETIDVLDFGPFAAQQKVFLLYSNGTIEDWWPGRLLHEGDRLELLALQGNRAMYLVELEAPHMN